VPNNQVSSIAHHKIMDLKLDDIRFHVSLIWGDNHDDICLVKLPLDDTETLFESELELDGPRDTNW